MYEFDSDDEIDDVDGTGGAGVPVIPEPGQPGDDEHFADILADKPAFIDTEPENCGAKDCGSKTHCMFNPESGLTDTNQGRYVYMRWITKPSGPYSSTAQSHTASRLL